MRDWRAIFGRNVRRTRQQKGLTQEQLAFEAEIDLTYLGAIERGRRNPSLLVMARIAKALSVTFPKLLSKYFPSKAGVAEPRGANQGYCAEAPGGFCFLAGAISHTPDLRSHLLQSV